MRSKKMSHQREVVLSDSGESVYVIVDIDDYPRDVAVHPGRAEELRAAGAGRAVLKIPIDRHLGSGEIAPTSYSRAQDRLITTLEEIRSAATAIDEVTSDSTIADQRLVDLSDRLHATVNVMSLSRAVSRNATAPFREMMIEEMAAAAHAAPNGVDWDEWLDVNPKVQDVYRTEASAAFETLLTLTSPTNGGVDA